MELISDDVGVHGTEMFETVFNPRATLSHRRAPLRREREEFLTYLQRRGTGRDCLRVYASRLNQIVRFLRLTGMRPVKPAEIQRAARRWAKYKGSSRHVSAGPWSEPTFAWLAKRWLKFHKKLIMPKRVVAFDGQLRRYARSMELNGLSPVTIKSRIHETQRFLAACTRRRPKRRLRTISLKDVDAYFKKMEDRWGPVSFSSCAAILRAFFVYAEAQGCCRPGIASGIKGPHIRSHSAVAGGPSWPDVQRLLCSTRGGSAVNLRARAILLLLALYGLRRGEIIRLRLRDFDWRKRAFTVRRSKHGGLQQFPISSEVSEAIQQYIKHSRSRTTAENLFVSFHPPFGPLYPMTVNLIVSSRMKKLNIQSRRLGPHALRHACATELLRRGVSPRGIADFLGHRTCQTVSTYAKFDQSALRKVSRLDLVGAL